ncbi:MAG TPA: hypothetical protein VL053_15040 [Arachidicoccus sp.]|nr:hypothetical protein [Arachidicoccus sp.]
MEDEKNANEGTGRNDGLWKGLIEDCLSEFIDFFFPAEAADYDISKVQYLDKELEVLLKDKGEDRIKRFVDKLILIERKSKKGEPVLLHIEIEGRTDATIAARMFHYYTLIYGKYRKPINALAVFTGVRKKEVNRFISTDGETNCNYKFGIYCVNNQETDQLKRSQNPLALVILALRLYLKRSKLSDSRLMAEFIWIYEKLMRMEISTSKMDTIGMFLEDYMRLCLENMEEFPNFVKRINLIKKNNNVMGIKEMVLEQGREQGRSETILQVLKALLKDGTNTIEKIAAILGVSEDFVRTAKKDLKIV